MYDTRKKNGARIVSFFPLTWPLLRVGPDEVDLRVVEYLVVLVGRELVHVELHDLLRGGHHRLGLHRLRDGRGGGGGGDDARRRRGGGRRGGDGRGGGVVGRLRRGGAAAAAVLLVLGALHGGVCAVLHDAVVVEVVAHGGGVAHVGEGLHAVEVQGAGGGGAADHGGGRGRRGRRDARCRSRGAGVGG